MLVVEEINSSNQIRELQTIWENLLLKSEDYSIFLSYDWFLCCIQSYSKDKELLILVIKDRKDIIGIAPFWKYKEHIRGIKMTKISFVNGPDTPFVDFIIHYGKHREVMSAMLKYLYTCKKGHWDILTLNQWPSESPNYSALKEIINEQYRHVFDGYSSMVPYISLIRDWESFLRSRSAKFRKTRRNINNRIQKLKDVEVRCYKEDKYGTILKQVLSVSEKGWKQQEGIAMSSCEENKLFFSLLSDAANNHSWLMIWLLYVEGVPIAMEYDLVHGKKVYALRADFDEKFKEYSPGAYLEYHIIQYLCKEGYLEYNTGPGLNAYKLNWTGKMKQNVTMNICNNNIKGSMISLLERNIFPTLKRIRTRISLN